jgi:hypothetical protein
LVLWMYGGGSGGRLAFSSLVGSSLLLSAVECHHFSNGYHSEKERDMSQAAFAALFLTNATAARAGVRRTPTAAGAVRSSVAVVLTTTGKGLS